MATAVVALLAAFWAGQRTTQLPQPQRPTTSVIHYSPSENVSRSDVAFDIPLSELADQRSSPFKPEQVSLHHASPTEMWVIFATGVAVTGVGRPPPPPPEPRHPPSVTVSRANGLSHTFKAETPSGQYTKQSSTEKQVQGSFYNASWYQSQFLWTVKLTGLLPDISYTYVVVTTDGGGSALRSSTYTLQSLPAVGSRSHVRIGVFGDLGQTHYSKQTLQRLAAEEPGIILNMGDLTYADAFDADAAPHGSLESGSAVSGAKWDAWGRLTSPIFAKAPHQAVHGNHEKSERSRGRMDSLQFRRRYPSAHASSHSSLYYSFSFGLVKTVFLSMYTDYSRTSAQYSWFTDEMHSRLDRSMTPWLVLAFHAPVYSTYAAHYKEVECFRQLYEPLWTEYGADIIFSGHVHAYERSNPVRSYSVDPGGCAPTFITIGDGGNHEGIYQTYEDQDCPADGVADAAAVAAYYGDMRDDSCVPGNLATFVNGSTVPYCDLKQPAWSAYREDAFGHGVLDINADGQTARWSWQSNMGSHSVSSDSIRLQRSVIACPNRAYGTLA